MFRELSEGEKANFKAWARKNYTPGDDISELWHPVIQSECDAMNYEARQAYRFETHYFEAPSAWVCMLMYGDESGLSQDDIDDCNAFVARIGLGSPQDAEGEFLGRHNGLITDMTNYAFFKKVKVSR